MNDTYEAKIVPIRLFSVLGLLTDEQKLKEKVIERYYKSVEMFMRCKIKFWEQFNAHQLDANILEKINETMTDFLEAGWEYLGQADIREESERAKDEYDMFKKMFDTGGRKIKKKTRRGGKNHKK